MLKQDKEYKIIDELYNHLIELNKSDLIAIILDNKNKIFDKEYLNNFLQ